MIEWYYFDEYEESGRTIVERQKTMFTTKETDGSNTWESFIDCYENTTVFVIGNIYENPDLLEVTE